MAKENIEEDKIVVSHVYKTFNIYLDKANSLKEKMLFWNRNKREKREVLKDVSLTIKKGEAVALIGVNGSGKSTLLKLMTKIIYPNKGKIVTNGKLTSLLELGAGFHPDFSGRENIYFNAQMSAMQLEKYCRLGEKEQEFMEKVYDKFHLTSRGYHKILKTARTIADIEECTEIEIAHLSEALSYRSYRSVIE